MYPVHVYVLVCSRIRAHVFTYTWCPCIHVYVLVCSRIRAHAFTYTWCPCVHVYVLVCSRIRASVFTYTSRVFLEGIEYSALLRQACSTISNPAGHIALFNINWDGALVGFGARSCTPIQVQVMNSNSSSPLAVGLLGYLPSISVPDGYKTQKNYLDARFHVLQTCIGHVLHMIEMRSKHGFKCSLGGELKLCYARVGVMSLDTPERVKYFGLRNMTSCAICRKRKGRSLARKATFHCPTEVANLHASANDMTSNTRPAQRARKRARERLQRHGLSYKRRCTLTDHAKHCLVDIPSFGPRLFGGLARYERMHVYFINYCTYALELLIKSVPKKNYAAVQAAVQQCHQFRDPLTGATHPRLPNLLKMTHLTAERRVRAIFYWAHVLGVQARVVYEAIRHTTQRAVAYLQLILIAVRGHRAYTSGEWDVIFRGTGRQFFIALEELAQYHDEKDYDNKMVAHRRDPDRNAAPQHFAQTTR